MAFSAFLNRVISGPILTIAIVLTLNTVFIGKQASTPGTVTAYIAAHYVPTHTTVLVDTTFGFLNILVVARFGTDITGAVSRVISFNKGDAVTLTYLYTTLFSVIICNTATSHFNVPASRDRDLVTNLANTTVTLNNTDDIGIRRQVGIVCNLTLSVNLNFIVNQILYGLISVLFTTTGEQHTGIFFGCTRVTDTTTVDFVRNTRSKRGFVNILFLNITFTDNRADINSTNVPVQVVLLYSTAVNVNADINNRHVVGSINRDVIGLRGCRNFSTSLTNTTGLLLTALANVPISSARVGAYTVVNINAIGHLSTVGFNIIGSVVFAQFFAFPTYKLVDFIVTGLFVVFL